MARDAFEDELLDERIRTNILDPVLLRRLLRYARPYATWIATATALVGLSAFLAILPASLVGALVDLSFTGGDGLPARAVARVLGAFVEGGSATILALPPSGKLVLFSLLFLVLRLVTFVVDWGNGYILARLGQRVVLDLRLEVFRHMHALSLSFFHRNPVGRLVTRTVNDVGSLEELFSTVLVTILKDIGMLLGIVIFLLLFHWKLALIVLSVLPLMVFSAAIFRRHSRRAYRRWRAELSRLNAFMAEALSGIRVVQLFHKEERNDSAYDAIGRSYRHHFLLQRRAWAYFRPVNTTLSAAGIGLVLWFGGHAVLGADTNAGATSLALGGTMTVGLLASFLAYAEQFFAPIRDFTEKFDVMQGAMTSAERIFTVLDTSPDLADRAQARTAPRFRGEIEFDDVSFSYVAGQPVLHSVSFRIPEGTSVAIVGHTGAGKTTIINLLGRLYEIDDGSIRIDKDDIRAFTMSSLRRNIAVVHQDVFLFAGTVLENIRLGDPAIPRERVYAACASLHIEPFILRLPGGYDAVVEEGGKTFSAGERQLLSFARALVADPTILVLDEATSSIDTHTERLIQSALTTMTRGRTSIIIAHRLSTVRSADNILVMHHGRVAEHGTHDELLARREVYEKLYRLQYAAGASRVEAAARRG